MTEELEKKLNELLGMKKQLEEITEHKKQNAIFNQYKKEAKSARIRFWVGFSLGLLGYWSFVGLAGCIYNNNFLKFIFMGIGILCLSLPGFAKLGWVIRQSKLTILQEIKESELRILEMLKK